MRIRPFRELRRVTFGWRLQDTAECQFLDSALVSEPYRPQPMTYAICWLIWLERMVPGTDPLNSSRLHGQSLVGEPWRTHASPGRDMLNFLNPLLANP